MAAALVSLLLIVSASHTTLCESYPELFPLGGEQAYSKHRVRPRRGLLDGLVGSLLTVPSAPGCSDARGDSFNLGATLPLGISAGLSSSSAEATSKQGCGANAGSVSGGSHGVSSGGHTSSQASSGSAAHSGVVVPNSQYAFTNGGGFQSGNFAGRERGSGSHAVGVDGAIAVQEAGSLNVGSESSSHAASASKGGYPQEGNVNTLGGPATSFTGENGVYGASVPNNIGTDLQEVYQGDTKHGRVPQTDGAAFSTSFSESKASSSSGSSSKGSYGNFFSSSNSNASSSSHSNSARIA